MSVESFDPGAAATALDQKALDRLLEVGAVFTPESGSAPEVALSQLERASFAGLMTAPAADWMTMVEPLTDAQIESLVRLLTVAEDQISGWQAGDKSPVIALVKVLKSRGSYDRTLTRWIKANSNNRFLPHGSLMDRL